jgi:tetratricopeptide (TPR) repeat protein
MTAEESAAQRPPYRSPNGAAAETNSPNADDGTKNGQAMFEAIVAIAMPGSRIEILKSMVERNPGDAFGRYGLAMEYVNNGHLESAAEQFQLLLEHNPAYAAGYFHGGQTLEKLGRHADAKETYRKGIEVTTATGDAHTRSELEGALALLG